MNCRDVGRFVSIVLAGALIALGPAPPVGATSVEAPIALWVWERPTDAVAGTVATDGFDRVFLHVPPGSTVDPAVDAFVASLQGQSVEVYALAGAPGWSERHDKMQNWLDEIVASALFDGIVLDVEPYLLSDWTNPKRRVGLLEDYLGLLDLAAEGSQALPVVVTVPFWWDAARYRVRREVLLVEEVLLRSDSIAVMAYRDRVDTSDGVVALVETEIALAADFSKSTIVTLQTAPDAHPKLTFQEEGRRALDAVIHTLSERWEPGRGFGGLAVHFYRSYVELPP